MSWQGLKGLIAEQKREALRRRAVENPSESGSREVVVDKQSDLPALQGNGALQAENAYVHHRSRGAEIEGGGAANVPSTLGTGGLTGGLTSGLISAFSAPNASTQEQRHCGDHGHGRSPEPVSSAVAQDSAQESETASRTNHRHADERSMNLTMSEIQLRNRKRSLATLNRDSSALISNDVDSLGMLTGDYAADEDESGKMGSWAVTTPHSCPQVMPQDAAEARTNSGGNPKKRRESLSEVTNRLAQLREPLKLFGESQADVRQRLRELEASVDIPERPTHNPALLQRLANYRRSDNFHSGAERDAAVALRFIGSRLARWEEKLTQPATQGHDGTANSATSPSEAHAHTRAVKIFHSTVEDIWPLILALYRGTLPAELIRKLANIADMCDERNYVKAHDVYLSIAIGNAAWPMGVTMVGIHERAGRSRIASSEIAHLLNDETVRKYVQMVKRLLTLSEKWSPSDD